MNTVGKPGHLGEAIRCVVSVSMLTEGWDANSVTHILGVRAFETQLLCEQVVGRALRRQSYDLNPDYADAQNPEGLFDVEYADILGIPFDFTAKPVISKPQTPRESVHVRAVRPERDHLEIRFPRVEGYRVELPDERLDATFDEDSVLVLTPDIVGPSITLNAGIIGEDVNLNLEHLQDLRRSTILYNVTTRLLFTRYRDKDRMPEMHLFGQLKRITKKWMDNYLVCKGGTYPGQLMYQELANMACERIHAGITRHFIGERPIQVVLDPYNPEGSTVHVNFYTSKALRWQTDPRKSHVNWAVLDSNWEGEFCRVIEAHPQVHSYVKNQGLGLEVPYRYGSIVRKYIPDYILQIDDGQKDLLNLVVEVKGYRGEDAKIKKQTMDNYWIPGVNHARTFGRWAFVELRDVWLMEDQLTVKIEEEFNRLILSVAEEQKKEVA
jgi:type III restriction enzyme